LKVKKTLVLTGVFFFNVIGGREKCRSRNWSFQIADEQCLFEDSGAVADDERFTGQI
jgi:hypothetical protein